MLVYRVTNTVNGKVYIGKWSKDAVERRWQMHQASAKHGSLCYFHKAIRKYGADTFIVEVIHRAKTPAELSAMETFFIVLHQSYVPANGYNMTMGGEGTAGYFQSPETRAKISRAKKDKPLSLEHRLHIGKAHKGRKQSAEWVAKRVVALKARGTYTPSIETRAKMRDAQLTLYKSDPTYKVRLGVARKTAWTLERRAAQSARIAKYYQEKKAA